MRAIVLTADHGISITTGQPRRRISRENINEISLVPFSMLWPKVHGNAPTDSFATFATAEKETSISPF